MVTGDSNISKIPPFSIPDLQVDSFPGASLKHAEAILSTATNNTTVEKMVLSFGLNNRSQKTPDTTVKELQKMLRVAKNRFPHAKINFSRVLPHSEQNILTHLNHYIAQNCEYIMALPHTSSTLRGTWFIRPEQQLSASQITGMNT